MKRELAIMFLKFVVFDLLIDVLCGDAVNISKLFRAIMVGLRDLKLDE